MRAIGQHTVLDQIETVLILKHVEPGEAGVDVETGHAEGVVMIPERGRVLVVLVCHRGGDELPSHLAWSICAGTALALGEPLLWQTIVSGVVVPAMQVGDNRRETFLQRAPKRFGDVERSIDWQQVPIDGQLVLPVHRDSLALIGQDGRTRITGVLPRSVAPNCR